MYLKSIKIFCLFPCFIVGQLISPVDNDSLNTVHVLFEWDQLSNAVSYQIQVAESESSDFENLTANLIDSTLVTIIDEGLLWGTTYSWRIRSVNLMGNFGEWSETRIFHIKPLPPVIVSLDVSIYDSSYKDGLTVMDRLGEGIIYAIDIHGDPVWFVNSNIDWSNGGTYLIQFSHFLPDGGFIGIADGRSGNLSGRAFEMGIHNNLIWEGPGDVDNNGVHHDVFPMPNGNILALTVNDTLVPIPDEIDIPEEYSYIDSIRWHGDRIVEWDRGGNEVWSWSVFDHFDMQDFVSESFESMFTPPNNPTDFFYDWTHSNAVWYDIEDSVVYLSVRHLSRITKIDYPSGNILWNMGKSMPSGDVAVGNHLGLSGQHSVKVLDNRNIMVYDNGFESDSLESRGLEISVINSDSIAEAEIIWEYILPDGLGSPMMSDCDRLPNGNSLLTSSAPMVNYIVEVLPSNEIVWEILPGQDGSTFRAERIPGLYKHVFSIVQPDFTDGDDGATLELIPGNVILEYRIINEGWQNENYLYTLSDDLGWFSDSGSVEINSREETELYFSGIVPNEGTANTLMFTVFPENAIQLVRVISLILEPSLSIGTPLFSKAFSINPAFPNPFNPVTTIQFTLPMVETWHAVSLQIYDITGTLVETLMDEKLEPGQHTVKWNGTGFSSGVYFLKVEAGSFSQVEKLMLIK